LLVASRQRDSAIKAANRSGGRIDRKILHESNHIVTREIIKKSRLNSEGELSVETKPKEQIMTTIKLLAVIACLAIATAAQAQVIGGRPQAGQSSAGAGRMSQTNATASPTQQSDQDDNTSKTKKKTKKNKNNARSSDEKTQDTDDNGSKTEKKGQD
jgi:hypothetical protein